MKTPHRASSLCCHETNDGRIAKLTHTPSMKAGQLSRHSCNQIPRGRYQHAKVQAGPEHQTRQPAGEGRQRGRRKEPQQRRADNKRSTKTTQSHEPRRATHARDHKITKETESSTDNISAEYSALDQGKARSTDVRTFKLSSIHSFVSESRGK